MKKLVLSVSLVFVPLLLNADSVVEEIIARVNNEIITRTEYQRSRDQVRQEIQQQNPDNSATLFSERDKNILRDLIDQKLLLAKGKDLDISADTELVKRLDDMRKQMNLDSMDDLEKAAEAQGVSFEDFKQNLREQIITQQVIGKEVGAHLTITKEEEQKFYNDHTAEMAHPEQIRLSEILIAPPAPADPKTPADDPQAMAAAQAKANQVLDEIHHGTSFEDAAKKYSSGPTAAQGGDLGYFKRGTLAKELEDTTFAMNAGDISDVIRTKQGYVILKVSEHQQAGTPTLADVEPRVQDAIYMKKLEPALRAYLTKLREEAFIDIKPGYVDTAASPNETKPVETTSANEDAKKLKKKKVLGVF
jgi:peptidyl-prolyl cis-trans isomerase SurA